MSPFPPNVPNPILSLLRQYLIDPPFISSFHWSPNSTPFSSPFFLSSSILSYISLTLLLRVSLKFRVPPSLLLPLSISHNLFLLLLSSLLSLSSLLLLLPPTPPSLLLCFPPSTPPFGPLFFWAYIFYLSKFYEFLDTALIIFSSPRRLSFLHVYHHAFVVLMSYLWLSTSQSLFPLALFTNSSVHVFMYSYYLSSSLGFRWGLRWKRALTRLQIVQFVFSFLASVGFLWMHFARGGCAGVKGWIFNAVFNASLLLLFVNFHRKAYGKED